MISVMEVPPPAYSDNEVLVANAYSVISVGTELSMITGSKRSSPLNVLKNPDLMKKALSYMRKSGIKKTLNAAREFQGSSATPIGYSSAGIVIAAGKNVADIGLGDKVACAGAGIASHAEIICVPRNLIAKIPEKTSFEEAAFTTLGAIAVQGVRRADMQLGETTVVLGTGLIGQLTVQIAKAAGCRVVAVDTPERVDLAVRMGADLGLVIGKRNVENEVFNFTDGYGADAVIICAATSSSEPVNQAIRMIREKGRVVVVGSVGMNLERQPFYDNEGVFLISRSCGPGRYDALYEKKGIDYPIGYVRWTENRNMQSFLNLLKDKKVNVNALVDAVFPIDEAEKAYDLLIGDKKKPLGILLRYKPSLYVSTIEKTALSEETIEISPRKVKGKINVAVVGAGNFAKSILLPLISKIPDHNLKAIVTATGINAQQTALKYKAEYCTTDFKEVLEDNDVDLVMISTPHNLHYSMIIEAAKVGKAIYVEKPLCLNEDELDEIVKVVSETKIPLVVGFNRRYSRLSMKVARNTKFRHMIKSHTSGTTGKPLQFYVDSSENDKEWAFVCHQWSRVGYRPGEPRIDLSGPIRSEKNRVIYDPMSRVLTLSPQIDNEEICQYYLKKMRSFEARFLRGYPSAVASFAYMLKRYGLALPPKFKAVFFASEAVYDWEREIVEEVFKCRVFAHYGLAEHVASAAECEHSHFYHFLPQYGVTEIDPDTSEIIATSFLNYVNPFIRYRTTDVGSSPVLSKCEHCGRNYFPIIEEVQGRLGDYIITPRGTLISPAVITFPFKDPKTIKDNQLIQESTDKLVLRVVLWDRCISKASTAELKRLNNDLQEILGVDMQIDIEIVDEIERLKSGKFKWIVSNVSKDLIEKGLDNY
jgi:phenylacetate-coenzyme A ligase PaaK-like adenylate-forming protein/threonine dehydrogenase-like Zn-dependent dehydrogenase